MESVPEYITLTQASKLCPTKPCISAIWRWCRRGLKSRSGKRVRLEHLRVGRRVLTTRSSLERFFRELTAADMPHFDSQTASISKPARSKAHARAERELKRRGVL